MDLSSAIGFVATFGLVLYSMSSGGNMLLFYDQPSAVMVGGGTITVVMVCFTFAELKVIFKVMMRTFLFKLPSPPAEIDRIITYANLARKEGLLALENKLQEVDDKFFAKGIQLVIDGFSAETVRDIMELEADWQLQRHKLGKKMMDSAATFAPAFGMIGTLIGLVQMLANLSDPAGIGAGMAIALLTTMYGAILANMVFLPFAAKLELRANQEAHLRDLMIEGIVAIQSGEKPQLIREKLKGFLAPGERESVAAG